MKLSPSHARKLSSLVAVDKKYRAMNVQAGRQVRSELESQLDYLLGRKEREFMRREKLKEMEAQFERERRAKRGQMRQRAEQSEMNRTQSLLKQRNKTSQSMSSLKEVELKNKRNERHQLREMLEKRKAYETGLKDSRVSVSSKKSTASLRSHSMSKTFLDTQRDRLMGQVEGKILKIDERIGQARRHNRQVGEIKSAKAREYQVNPEEIRAKINKREDAEELSCWQDYSNRSIRRNEGRAHAHALQLGLSEQKRRDMADKSKRCRDNIQHLERERREKETQLQDKWGRRSAEPDGVVGRQAKNSVYLQKFLVNQKRISMQRSQRADQIMDRHNTMTLKRRALTDRKGQMMQTVQSIHY